MRRYGEKLFCEDLPCVLLGFVNLDVEPDRKVVFSLGFLKCLGRKKADLSLVFARFRGSERMDSRDVKGALGSSLASKYLIRYMYINI